MTSAEVGNAPALYHRRVRWPGRRASRRQTSSLTCAGPPRGVLTGAAASLRAETGGSTPRIWPLIISHSRTRRAATPCSKTRSKAAFERSRPTPRQRAFSAHEGSDRVESKLLEPELSASSIGRPARPRPFQVPGRRRWAGQVPARREQQPQPTAGGDRPGARSSDRAELRRRS